MYRVACTSCQRSYDAEAAVECSCLHPVRSLLCPHCAKCFCSAGRAVLDEFWRNAPPSVWKRRLASGRTTSKESLPEPDGDQAVVLFADDDPIARAIAAQVIRSAGYGVVVAASGTEALELARRYRPNLLITDALMPGLDGREVSKTIRKEMASTRIVIITSVYKDPRYKHEAMRDFAADEYLIKPVSPDRLREIITKHMP